MNHAEIDLSIRKEADSLIHATGLHNLLEYFGTPHYTGSYSLNLMTWRDLDIYLENEILKTAKFFEMGKQLNELLNPVKMSFRNETIANTKGLPKGLYWGVYLGDERKGAWKIDIWMMDSEQCKQRLEYTTALSKKLTEQNRQIILSIKSACWQNPLYRKSFTSSDIYEAVLDHGIKSLESFSAYLSLKNERG